VKTPRLSSVRSAERSPERSARRPISSSPVPVRDQSSKRPTKSVSES
jgi:hypothetical protein